MSRKKNHKGHMVTSYIVHHIQTSLTIIKMKASSAIFMLMKEHNFYVNEHRWSETDWETKQLGIVYGIDPQFHYLNQATNIVAKALQSCSPQENPKVQMGLLLSKNPYKYIQLKRCVRIAMNSQNF
jgi:hypothetical protein